MIIELVEKSDTEADTLGVERLVGLEIVAVCPHEPAGLIALHFQGEMIGQGEMALPVVGTIVRHVGQEHLLGVVGSGVAEREVGGIVQMVSGRSIEPQTVAEELPAAFEGHVVAVVVQRTLGEQMAVLGIADGKAGAEVGGDSLLCGGRTVACGEAVTEEVEAVVQGGKQLLHLIALLEGEEVGIIIRGVARLYLFLLLQLLSILVGVGLVVGCLQVELM